MYFISNMQVYNSKEYRDGDTLNVAATFVKFAIPPPIIKTFPSVRFSRVMRESIVLA